MTSDFVETGVQLLERLEHEELSMAELMDRIETITSNPQVTREIIETAEQRDIIERTERGSVRPSSGQFLSFESEVITKDGEFTCKRCGASISTGYFMKLKAAEHGPFGSSCIRKVTGRED